MSSVSSGTALPHRSLMNVRSGPGQSQSGIGATPGTPPRTTTATYGSPSTIRADDDFLIIGIGSRFLRVGFAGDNLPKAVVSCGPETQRRAGDFRDLQAGGTSNLERPPEDYEIWRYDLREVDVGLVHDKLDRLLRDAFMRCLLIDSRPRRAGLVLDSAVPVPLLSAVLDLLFKAFHTPMVSLMSSATMAAVGAGVRSALVIDMGWAETVVTSVYEYREVRCTRSVRGGKYLERGFHEALKKVIAGNRSGDGESRVISFEESEDMMCRLMWCRPSSLKPARRQSSQLDTVEEQDESETDSAAGSAQPSGVATMWLKSTNPPKTIEISFDKIADICDDTFFDQSKVPTQFDDEEVPVHLLIYQHLLRLPMDVRAICMSRIIFTGGCSTILGLKDRLLDEVKNMVERRGWANVSGKVVEDARNSQFFDRKASLAKPAVPQAATTEAVEEQDSSRPSSISTAASLQETDPIEAKLARHRPKAEQTQGEFRALNSLGPWAGASLMCQLKIPAMATVDRELWLQQGAYGATRASDVDVKAQQRQSLGTGGFIRGSGGHHTNWTLGTWGSVM